MMPLQTGNLRLANQVPHRAEFTVVYVNRLFYFIENNWWVANEDGILHNIIDAEILELLNAAKLVMF